VQLLDRRFHERACPREARRARCEVTQRARTQLRQPPFRVEPLLGADGVFEVSLDATESGRIADTATPPPREARRVARGEWGAGRVAVPGRLGGNVEDRARMCSPADPVD
jgi:hypothetical protein